ncbi:MAG: membrane protein insertase YidC [Bacteroidota bacterium]
MDKQATIGFILIGLVLILWMWLAAPPPVPQQQQQQKKIDSTGPVSPQQSQITKLPQEIPVKKANIDTLGKWFSDLPSDKESLITIETDLYKAVFSSKGALLKEWTLKNYKTWNGYPVQLIEYNTGGDLSLLFTTMDGKLLNTRSFSFSIAGGPRSVTLSDDEEYTFEMVLQLKGGRTISKIFHCKNGLYSFDADFRLNGMGDVISNFEYQIVWENGLRLTEGNSVDEANYAASYAFIGGELVEVNATDFDKEHKSDLTGSSDWVSMRNKYFALAIIPRSLKGTGSYLYGTRTHEPNNGVKEKYSIALKLPYRGTTQETVTITVFLGPLDYNLIKGFGVELQRIMSFGIEWLVRPISIYFMLPLFNFLRSFIPNYGLVIIVFTLIIRILLYPLMRTSMKSMKKMQQLQPLMEEIKTKYKEEPEKMNREVMKLYKDYGVNPASGCLPLLLQLPILYALWAVFSTAISLRQASFIWWITDLSIPDVIMTLPFTIPIFGGNHISGLALFMGISMFVQQKMTTKDPRQKTMIWLFPIMMTLMFNNLPSGLNLYYSVFNVTAIIQQYWTTHKDGEEPLRKVESKKKRGGIFAKLSSNMPSPKSK